ncbi:excinuclease ABC subunit C [Paenibacillus swuensis]|uniref:Excinuclease ABC subunit C n=1 Tax=Paenibacillus swuensis TaxID=1178515 RepID=A0A172TKS8_9BACL|nr:GIY-YIG nuclease family protein [Paenibacillus swuensis]ANE47669.1 excinuclease ABC subunit C [Paenibacillus swuensis]
MSFRFQASDYPEQPGCYLMKDTEQRILYVGKSKNLRNRLRSYFYQKHKRRRLAELVVNIRSIEVILVNNESESLVLENNLIKIHKPPYNRALKRDNSGYAYLQMTGEPLPRLDVYYRDRRTTQEREQAGAFLPERKEEQGQRFGPFVSSRFQYAMLDFVTDHYRLRTCTSLPKRACLLYHIGKCSGVCEGWISEADYQETARQASEMLSHRRDHLLTAMHEKMTHYAERLEFEKAQNMLHHIRVLERIPTKQIVDRETGWNQDVLYFGERDVLIARVQEGMLRDFRFVAMDPSVGSDPEEQFILSQYEQEGPDELIVNRMKDPVQMRKLLRTRSRRSVAITVPKRGLKADLLQLCKANYEYRIAQREAAVAANQN